jgi:hypothetical protein
LRGFGCGLSAGSREPGVRGRMMNSGTVCSMRMDSGSAGPWNQVSLQRPQRTWRPATPKAAASTTKRAEQLGQETIIRERTLNR